MKDWFEGKWALVTGASSGIGEAFARALAGRGANLVVTARSADKLRALAEELKTNSQISVHCIPADLAAAGAAAELHKETERSGLAIDLLINNAGFGKWGAFLEFDGATYQEMLTLNIHSLVELCRLYAPAMVSRHSGGIINVASTAAFLPVPFAAVYSASKSFVLDFSEALHGELGEHGVRVLALCPGGTETNFAAVASNGTKLANQAAPADVAEVGLKALIAGRSSVVSGRANYALTLLPRVLPREAVIRLSGSSWRKMIGR